MITTETELSKYLDTFYVHCPFTRLNHQGDMITYKIGKDKHGNAFALDEANRIIRENNLPLKAEIQELNFQYRHNILCISSK